jgi:hypothetical protein
LSLEENRSLTSFAAGVTVQELEAVGGLDELENMLIAAELRDQAAKQAEEAGERHFH